MSDPAGGNSYDFDPTGVSIDVNDISDGGNTTFLLFARTPCAPVNPQFGGAGAARAAGAA